MVGAVVKRIRPALPSWPLPLLMFNVPAFAWLRLAKVKSADCTPTIVPGVELMLLPPWSMVSAPSVSAEAVWLRPV